MRSIIDVLEGQLLALGPMPLRGENHWTSDAWERYAAIVRSLADQLTWSGRVRSGPEPLDD